MTSGDVVAAVRHHRSGLQAARSRGGSGGGRAKSHPGAGADAGQRGRGQLRAAQSPRRSEAGGTRRAQESSAGRDRREGERSGGGIGARGAFDQLERDLANRKATSQAGVAIQEAAVAKAKVQAEQAKQEYRDDDAARDRGGIRERAAEHEQSILFSGHGAADVAGRRHGSRGHGGRADSRHAALGR